MLDSETEEKIIGSYKIKPEGCPIQGWTLRCCKKCFDGMCKEKETRKLLAGSECIKYSLETGNWVWLFFTGSL